MTRHSDERALVVFRTGSYFEARCSAGSIIERLNAQAEGWYDKQDHWGNDLVALPDGSLIDASMVLCVRPVHDDAKPPKIVPGGQGHVTPGL